MWIDQLLLTLHILATATWIGAALALQVIATRVGPSTPDPVVDEFAFDAEAVAKTLFAPAAVVLLVTGVALSVRRHHEWTEAWISRWDWSARGGPGDRRRVLIPEGRRIAELARTNGHDPDEIRTRARRRFLVARVDLGLLIPAVATMGFRPR